ncbi:MAG: hypothetical protein WC983_00850 [Tissierellaceae bacterium]
MDTVESKENKTNKSGWKIIIALFVILILLPVGILGLIYRNNLNFKNNANQILSKMPGYIGTYFKNIPTEIERAEKINFLSEYYLGLESDMGADKLYIVKKEDESLYNDLLRNMSSISSSKTDAIKLKVRDMELRKDLLISIHEDVLKSEEDRFSSELARIETQDFETSLIEIEKRYGERDFLKTLDNTNRDILGKMLYYIDGDIREHILNNLSKEGRESVEAIIRSKYNRVNNLQEIAKVYETKPLDTIVNILGDTSNYSMDELGIIYKNLSTLKSAEILLYLDDDDFVEELFINIVEEEELLGRDSNITHDIGKTMKFLSEYEQKLKNLVGIYEKMTYEQISKIVETMINNTSTITALELDEENVLELSDRDIILDVLSRMKNQTLSKVFDLMKPEKASELTSLLARPNLGK